jgi:hypothetical protein
VPRFDEAHRRDAVSTCLLARLAAVTPAATTTLVIVISAAAAAQVPRGGSWRPPLRSAGCSPCSRAGRPTAPSSSTKVRMCLQPTCCMSHDELDVGGGRACTASHCWVLTCVVWNSVVEKYDATALGVSGGGGEYSVQSGNHGAQCAMIMTTHGIAGHGSVRVGMFVRSTWFMCTQPRCRLWLDEWSDAVAAGPLRLGSLRIHTAGWQRHHCIAHLGLMLLHATKAPLPQPDSKLAQPAADATVMCSHSSMSDALLISLR